MFTEEGARHDSATLRSVYDHEQNLLRTEREKKMASNEASMVSPSAATQTAMRNPAPEARSVPGAADLSSPPDVVRIVTDKDLRTRPIKLKRPKMNFVMHDRFKARPQRYYYTRKVSAGSFGQDNGCTAGTSVPTGVIHINTRISGPPQVTHQETVPVSSVDTPLTLEDFDFPDGSDFGELQQEEGQLATGDLSDELHGQFL